MSNTVVNITFLLISASKTTFSLNNLKILRPKVTKNLKNLLEKFCEFPHCGLNQLTSNFYSSLIFFCCLARSKIIFRQSIGIRLIRLHDQGREDSNWQKAERLIKKSFLGWNIFFSSIFQLLIWRPLIKNSSSSFKQEDKKT